MVKVIYSGESGQPEKAEVKADSLLEAEDMLRKTLLRNSIKKSFLYNIKVNGYYTFFLV